MMIGLCIYMNGGQGSYRCSEVMRSVSHRVRGFALFGRDYYCLLEWEWLNLGVGIPDAGCTN